MPMAADGCGGRVPRVPAVPWLDHVAAMIFAALAGPSVESRVDHCEIGQPSSNLEIIARGSLRGKMALASACLSLSRLV